jgi:alpha-tubulin suppressor-like RCC1 family protein
VVVSSLSNAAALVAGGVHTCAWLGSSQVRCWGGNESGQLGDGQTVKSPTPAVVSDTFDAVRLSAGYQNTCVVRASGEVSCWGTGTFGQLGNGYPWSGWPVTVFW